MRRDFNQAVEAFVSGTESRWWLSNVESARTMWLRRCAGRSAPRSGGLCRNRPGEAACLQVRQSAKVKWCLLPYGFVPAAARFADDLAIRVLDFCPPLHDRPAMQELLGHRVGGPTSSTAKNDLLSDQVLGVHAGFSTVRRTFPSEKVRALRLTVDAFPAVDVAPL